MNNPITDTYEDPVKGGKFWTIWLQNIASNLETTPQTQEQLLARMGLKSSEWEIEPFLDDLLREGRARRSTQAGSFTRTYSLPIGGTKETKPNESVEADKNASSESVLRSLEEKMLQLKSEVAGLADENKKLKSRPTGPLEITVKLEKDGKKSKVKLGLAHKQFESALKWVSARNKSGYPVPVWFYGNAGGGKSHMFRQLALAMGYKDYVIRGLGPTDTLGSIVGYKNHLTGEFVPGAITPEIYGKGGFVAFDELCNADPSVPIGLNDLVAGVDFRFANGKLVTKSKDFVLVASDNTNGLGSKGGFIRTKQDISALTRYVFFKLEYDEELEAQLCGNRKWAEYVQKARAFANSGVNTPVAITPRASINGAALLEAGIPAREVADATIFSHCGPDVRETIVSSIGEYIP